MRQALDTVWKVFVFVATYLTKPCQVEKHFSIVTGEVSRRVHWLESHLAKLKNSENESIATDINSTTPDKKICA